MIRGALNGGAEVELVGVSELVWFCAHRFPVFRLTVNKLLKGKRECLLHFHVFTNPEALGKKHRGSCSEAHCHRNMSDSVCLSLSIHKSLPFRSTSDSCRRLTELRFTSDSHHCLRESQDLFPCNFALHTHKKSNQNSHSSRLIHTYAAQ